MYALNELPSLIKSKKNNLLDLSNKPLIISIDSRTIKKGDVFLALNGVTFNGHHFCTEALNKGASALIISDYSYFSTNYSCFYVNDTYDVLISLASAFRKNFQGKVIGITGSSGKTTTKDICSNILDKEYNIIATRENDNNYIGVALTLLRLKKSDHIAIVEMGINACKEMECLAAMVRPDFFILTHIHHAHLEGLGSLKNIAYEKTKVLSYMSKDSHFIYHKGEPYITNMLHSFKGMVHPVDINQEAGLIYLSKTLPAFIKKNVALILTLLRLFKFSNDKIRVSIDNIKTSKGRFFIKKKASIIFIDDTYNANPSSVREGLDALLNISCKRRIICIGDMKELGKQALFWHYAVFLKALSIKPYALILIGPMLNSVYKMHQEKVSSSIKLCTVLSVNEALNKWSISLCKGDLIYAKASRKLGLDKLLKKLEYICDVNDFSSKS